MAYSPTAHKDWVEKQTAWFQNQRIDVAIAPRYNENNINSVEGQQRKKIEK